MSLTEDPPNRNPSRNPVRFVLLTIVIRLVCRGACAASDTGSDSDKSVSAEAPAPVRVIQQMLIQWFWGLGQSPPAAGGPPPDPEAENFWAF